MGKSEDAFVAWLMERFPRAGPDLPLGIGDDMAILRAGTGMESVKHPPPPGGALLLAGADMLMDGVDFDMRIHAPEQAGRKALAAGLSDCAAMAVRPRWALVSVALPNDWSMEQARRLYLGMIPLADRYGCRIVGGDTNSWNGPLVVDVAVLAEPWPGIPPVRRSGMKPGDWVCVTGPLGGSLIEHHLAFEPRLWEARLLAMELEDRLHALMDLSDGLSTDATRLAMASGCGIVFQGDALDAVASDAARVLSGRDGRTPRDHALNDGEDFELLMAISPPVEARGDPAAYAADRIVIRQARSGPATEAAGSAAAAGSSGPSIDSCAITIIGVATEQPGLWIEERDPASGVPRRAALPPGGWQHFKS